MQHDWWHSQTECNDCKCLIDYANRLFCLPNNEKLYSNLNIENVSENDSEYSKNVWNTFY